jgi:hypothetical protein
MEEERDICRYIMIERERKKSKGRKGGGERKKDG